MRQSDNTLLQWGKVQLRQYRLSTIVMNINTYKTKNLSQESYWLHLKSNCFPRLCRSSELCNELSSPGFDRSDITINLSGKDCRNNILKMSHALNVHERDLAGTGNADDVKSGKCQWDVCTAWASDCYCVETQEERRYMKKKRFPSDQMY